MAGLVCEKVAGRVGRPSLVRACLLLLLLLLLRLLPLLLRLLSLLAKKRSRAATVTLEPPGAGSCASQRSWPRGRLNEHLNGAAVVPL